VIQAFFPFTFLHDGKLKVPISSSIFFSPTLYFTKHLFTAESCSYPIAMFLLNQLSALQSLYISVSDFHSMFTLFSGLCYTTSIVYS